MPTVFPVDRGALFRRRTTIRVCRAIYLRAEGPVALAPELAVLFLFGTVLIALAIRSIGARLVKSRRGFLDERAGRSRTASRSSSDTIGRSSAS